MLAPSIRTRGRSHQPWQRKRAILSKHRRDLTRRPGSAEQKALHLRTALKSNKGKLFLGLNTFRRCLNTHATGNARYGPYNGQIRSLRDIEYEGSVNLDFVEWKPPQIS
jgi:hypothetical protein